MSPPRTIGIYEVIRRLEGQSREVYLARSPLEADRDFVLALFEVSEGDRLALEKEVKHCMRVDHPAVTRTVEAFAHEGREVLVFESVVGASLHSLMAHLAREGEQLSDGAILHIGRALIDALEASHGATDERGKPLPLVHGQLSPYQVLIAWNGDVKLLGVGLSTIFRLAASTAQTPPEAEPYQAPEVRRGGQVTTRANVYSAAALLWALLMRKTPPDQGPLESLVKARPEIPKALAKALDQALEPVITRRTMTCQQLAKAFAGAAEACDREDLKWNMEVFRALIKVDEIMPTHSLPPSTLSQAPPDSISVIPPDSVLPDSDSAPPPRSKSMTDPPDSFEPFYDAPTERHDFSKFKASASSSSLSKRQGAKPTLIGTGPQPPGSGAVKSSPEGRDDDLDIDWDLPDEDEEPATRRRAEDATGGAAPAGTKVGKDKNGTKDTKDRKPPRLKPLARKDEAKSPKRTAAEDGPATKRTAERPGTGSKPGGDGAEPSDPGQAPAEPEPSRPSRPRASQPGKGPPPRPGKRLPPQRGPAGSAPPKRTKPATLPRPGRPTPSPSPTAAAEAAPTPRAPGVEASPSPPDDEDVAADRRDSSQPPATPPSDADASAPTSDAGAEAPTSDAGPADTPADDPAEVSPAEPIEALPPTPRSPTPAPPPPAAKVAAEAPSDESGAVPPAEPEPTPSPPQPTPSPTAAQASPAAPAKAPARPEQVIRVDMANVPARIAPGAVAPGTALPSQSDGQWRLPIRWLAVVAATALASFILGLLVSSGVEVSVTGGDAPPQPSGSPIPPGPTDATAPATPTPTPAPPPTAPPTPSTSAAPEEADGGAGTEDPAAEVDPSTLPPGRGYLLVESSRKDAEVYMKGVHAGPVGKPNAVSCGAGFVRLGTLPLTRWYGPGQVVSVPCQGMTRVTLHPGRNPPTGAGPGKGPGGDWVPSGL